jgi:transposase-like protein
MKGKRYTIEQKIRILREADQAGSTIVGVCQEHGISEQTFHRWKREFGMMELDQAKQLKELQKENTRLKRILADEMLGEEMLKEALEKTMSPGHKKQIIVAMVNRGCCTAREACRHYGLPSSTFCYEAKQPDAWMAKLKAALRRMSRQHPEMGYMKIARLLKKAGWRVGSRLIQRLRQQLGLMVPVKKPKRRRCGVSTGLPTKATNPNHVWTWDSSKLKVYGCRFWLG